MTSHTLSAAQLAANRSNAQASTGPKTAEGKAASSQNSLRHGLTGSNFVVLAWETQGDYDQLLADLRSEHKPSTPTEHLLVDAMAKHRWLAERAASLQELCFDDARPGHCAATLLSTYLRYQAHHERAFHKSLNELLKLRRERQREHDGFVSQTMRIANGHRNDDRHFLQLEILKTRLEKAKATAHPHQSAQPDANPTLPMAQSAPHDPTFPLPSI